MKILGIDIGITSIGWALIDDEAQKIIASGVRIFPQSTDREGKLLSAHRREARGRRRTLKRKCQRVAAIRHLIIKKGILSSKEITSLVEPKKKLQDVWQLRDQALKRKLTNEEWARVLIHIAKHRAYQSNRKSEDVGLLSTETKSNGGEKTDDEAIKERKKVLKAIRKNQQVMQAKGYLTIGSMLFNETRKTTRQRRNKKGKYNLCVSRDFLREEIDILFDKQLNFDNPHTTDKLKEEYKAAAFYQRPIKFNPKTIGNCTFEPNEKRAAKACYSAELFVLVGKLNNAHVINDTDGEIRKLSELRPIDEWLDAFKKQKTAITYTKIRKELELGSEWKFKHVNYAFNPETKKSIPKSIEEFYKQEGWLTPEHKAILERQVMDTSKDKPEFKRYKYSSVRKILAESSHMPESQKFAGVEYDDVEDEKFGELKAYHQLKAVIEKAKGGAADGQARLDKWAEDGTLDFIATELSSSKSGYGKGDEEIVKNLKSKGVDDALIDELLNLSFAGFMDLSLKALGNLLPLMKQGQKYHEACKEVYGHHSSFKSQNPQRFLRALNEQEKYQVTNPIVKRAFGEFRKVVNAVIRKHGRFDAMHLELAREMNHSKEKRIEIAMGQKEFRNEKEAILKKFIECFGREPKPKSSEFLKLRLYEQQHGQSLYSGQRFEIGQLLEDGYVQVDHALPRSRTFDNSLNNKVLCFTHENAEKGNQTPFEYIAGSDAESQQWREFKGRVNSLKTINKGKRTKLFNTTLPQRRGDDLNEADIENPQESFLARNLVDTAYIARFCKNFVKENLQFNNPEIKQPVKTRIGALTDQLRYSWGLDEKDRSKNHHHAEDAIILAFATQSEVKRLSDLTARHEDMEYEHAGERQKRLQLTPPFEGFREAVKTSMDALFVSFAPRRKVSGAAHKEQFYSPKSPRNHKFLEVKSGYAQKGEMKRIDVFKDAQGQYAIVPFYSYHFHKKEVTNITSKGKPLGKDYEFQFSLFKNDLIAFKQKDGDWNMGYFKHCKSHKHHSTQGVVVYQPHNQSSTKSKPKKGGQEFTYWNFSIGQKLIGLKKYQVDVLGNFHQIKGEGRLPIIKEMRAKKKAKKQ